MAAKTEKHERNSNFIIILKETAKALAHLADVMAEGGIATEDDTTQTASTQTMATNTEVIENRIFITDEKQIFEDVTSDWVTTPPFHDGEDCTQEYFSADDTQEIDIVSTDSTQKELIHEDLVGKYVQNGKIGYEDLVGKYVPSLRSGYVVISYGDCRLNYAYTVTKKGPYDVFYCKQCRFKIFTTNYIHGKCGDVEIYRLKGFNRCRKRK